MKRREFITGLAGAAWPLAARAQQAAMPVVGSLYSVSAAGWDDNMAGMRRGLSETGFIEGRNVAIEYRWADGQLDRMRAMAADLISRKVAVILAGGSNTGVREVIAATQTIPIVFTSAVDPVATGIVVSLARPGGNATGVTFIGSELVAKQLEIDCSEVRNPGAASLHQSTQTQRPPPRWQTRLSGQTPQRRKPRPSHSGSQKAGQSSRWRDRRHAIPVSWYPQAHAPGAGSMRGTGLLVPMRGTGWFHGGGQPVNAGWVFSAMWRNGLPPS
ncbi:MAG TPA: ABC transporter substrate binding protein [Mesorhizobium sp.]|nr:ABC transporter substrate binding protein [Mesorhizobium sp.]